MKDLDFLQLFLLLVILTFLTKPLGNYLYQVLNPKEKTRLDFIFKPLEKWTYRLCGIETKKEQSWKQYLLSIFVFSTVSLIFTSLILGLQHYLPLNPEKLGGISSHLNLNTSVSFVTNTNWQSYSGESTFSYFSQMVALTLQNFVSPAVGLGVAAAFVRGISRSSSKVIGNFWVDLVRITYYLLLPLAFIFAILFISQGTPQNFHPYTPVKTLETGAIQTLVQGPIASQEAIKLLGTNGGGFTGANSAHPYENPTPISNFLQILAILLIPAAQTYFLGKEIKNQKHGWCLYTAMTMIFVLGVFVCNKFEAKGIPAFQKFGTEIGSGNLEGKEQRFGVFSSALYTIAATTTSTGSANSAFDSYTPIGGLVPMFNMQLGEIIWGGVGSGLYSMLLFVILAIFTAGLIIGRSPEYVGNKISAFDVKLCIFALLPMVLSILGFTAWSCTHAWGTSNVGNSGAHGFSEILYAFSSCSANNGSAFGALSTNNPWWNITLSFAMLIGRFLLIAPVVALAGSFAEKKNFYIEESSFPISGTTFTLLLIGVIILVGALCFFPALIMGPFLEQFLMYNMSFF